MKRGVYKLKKDLNLFNTTLCGVGIIVGAGIYVLIGAAAGLAGNSVWLSFLISAIIAAFTGLSYAELSSMFSKDSGEYDYANRAFNRKVAFLVAYSVIISGIISVAAVALGFAGYFSALLSMDHLILIAIGAILIFSFVNYYGIKQSANLNVLFTLFEVGGLLLIIGLAVKYFGNVNYVEMPFGFKGILNAAALIFFAFLGFESVIKLAEETKNAKKIIPKALILSLVITTILYISVAIAAISILGWENLAGSKAPLADVANAVLGSKAFILLSIIALFSTGNTILIILITTSRMLYGISKDYKKLSLLTKVHKIRRTPHIAILATTIIAILFVLIGKIGIVAEYTNFAVFLTFCLVNLSLIVLRYKMPKRKRGFMVPINIGRFPILALFGALSSLFMIFYLQLSVIIGGIILIILGFILYYFVKN